MFESGQRKINPQSIHMTTGAIPRLAPYMKTRPLPSRVALVRLFSSGEKSEKGRSAVGLSCCSMMVRGVGKAMRLVSSLYVE